MSMNVKHGRIWVLAWMGAVCLSHSLRWCIWGREMLIPRFKPMSSQLKFRDPPHFQAFGFYFLLDFIQIIRGNRENQISKNNNNAILRCQLSFLEFGTWEWLRLSESKQEWGFLSLECVGFSSVNLFNVGESFEIALNFDSRSSWSTALMNCDCKCKSLKWLVMSGIVSLDSQIYFFGKENLHNIYQLKEQKE